MGNSGKRCGAWQLHRYPGGSQLGPQRGCCPGYPGFDSADRDAQTLGDLRLGNAVSDQAHHIRVDRWQLVEGLVDSEDCERSVRSVIVGRRIEASYLLSDSLLH